MPEETVTIPLSVYIGLCETQEWMDILDEAGIDNSEAYDYACEIRRKRFPERFG